MRKLLQKPFFKKVAGPVLRAAIKTFVPPLTPIVEAVKNLTRPGDKPQPHSWTSIGLQVVGWAVLLYALYTGLLPVEEVLGYLGFTK